MVPLPIVHADLGRSTSKIGDRVAQCSLGLDDETAVRTSADKGGTCSVHTWMQ
jgi:hypothetical protein